MAWPKYCKIQICYVGTQFPLYLWDTPQLRYMYLKVKYSKKYLRHIFLLSISRNLFHFTFQKTFNRDVNIQSSRHFERKKWATDAHAFYRRPHSVISRAQFISAFKTTWRNDSCLRGLALLEVSFRQIGSFNPLFHERKPHAVCFSQVFKRLLLVSVRHVENSYVLFWRKSAFSSVQPWYFSAF